MAEEYASFLIERDEDPSILKRYPDIIFEFPAVLSVLNRYSWHALEGAVRVYFEPLKVPVPHYSTIYRRCMNISLEELFYRYKHRSGTNKDGVFKRGAAIDSSGLKICGRGTGL